MISVITPAHNEARLIAGCLASVQAAACRTAESVEHIVVLNRCTDDTGKIALDGRARVITEDSRNIARVRNRGAAVARGRIIVTIDADSRMTPNMLEEVSRMLATGAYVGGGVRIVPERLSIGLVCSLMVVAPFVWRYGVSAGMFWCRRRDFAAVGGFDEDLVCLEDIDFGRRLRRHGRSLGRRYGTIRRAHVVTSCRKFDQFGDWYFVRHPGVVYRLFRRDTRQADMFYYDARSTKAPRKAP